MKCAIYTRVSTDEQGTSIINQQEYFKDYILRHNLEIHDIYSDEAFSGTETTKRLSFQRLLHDGKNKRYDVLLAKSYSRFGRNQRETLSALAELFEHGIRIIFVEDGLDSLRDKGQFGLFAWLAEQESRKISERLQMTWQLYNKEGKIHNSKETFGYDYNPAIKNFVVNREEAKTVKLIYEMYLRGYGKHKLARYLNENGYPAKVGNKWHGSPIGRILRNEFYLGHLIQGKYQVIDVTIKKSKHLDKSEWKIHKNNHEAIIPEELFYKVQAETKRRNEYLSQFKAVRHSSTHLLSNLVKCKICGGSCVAMKRRTGHTDICYSCRLYSQGGTISSGHKRNAMLEKDLAFIIRSELEMLSANDFETIKGYYNQSSDNKRHEHAKMDCQAIDKQIEEQTNLSNSLLGLFTEGVIEIEQFKLQNASIAEKIKTLSALKEKTLYEQSKLSVNVDSEGETIKAVRKLLECDISEWTNDMVKKVIDKIVIDKHNNEVEVFYSFAISN